MSATDTDSMASHVALLSKSFQQVPPAAIPAMLDCILASTGLSPMSLFSSLLDAFPNITKDILKEDGGLDSGKCNYIGSFVSSLCHLLKKFGYNDDALESFIWRCFIPLTKMVHGHDYEILNQTTELLFDVVIATNTWGVLEATLVPFFLRLVGLSMGMVQNDELAIYEWSSRSVFHLEMENKSMMDLSWSFPLPVSCHMLSLILDAALQSHEAGSTSESTLANEWCYAEKIAGSLLWDLCNITLLLLSQGSDHRSCAAGFLIPCTFKAFVSRCSFEISNHGKNCVISRKDFFIRMWKCCKTLFSLGTVERRDAYTVLSQYLSFFLCIEECEDAAMTDRTDEFDIRAENEFWDEIKKGLVDKEGLVRKQSLHILKTTLLINERSQCNSDVSEKILAEKDSIPQGMTKRGMWADKEANSLGVGKVSNSVAPCLNSLQRWEAFLLLYEMLEEYGTHLVEAAWSHQINLLFHSPPTNKRSVTNSRRVHKNQMETLEEVFDWLPILWERGFYHDNPQVRCLIMQSFLGIDWENHESYTISVPESFVLGPLIQGLNDHVHHQDFGVKGIYTSKTIEGATRFLCQFTRHLNVRKHISFLSNLASAAKQQSFGRAGLMGLAECIASAAYGVQMWHSDAFHKMFQVASPEESLSYNNKTDFLDVLRFVIDSSKQHFNHKYRLQVCRKILEAAASVVCTLEVPLEMLILFITAVPREFTDCGGSLRVEVHQWLLGCRTKRCNANCCCNKMKLTESLYDFPIRFISQQCVLNGSVNYDDEDIDAWEFKAKQWARVLFLVMKEEHQLEPLLMFIQNHGISVCQQNNQLEWVPVRFLILMLSLVQELQILQEKTVGHGMKFRRKSEYGLLEEVNLLGFREASIMFEKFAKSFLLILEELVSFAQFSCSIFWSTTLSENTALPCSIRGRLGGPSQRRLPSTSTTAVLQAITSTKAVAYISSWCAQFKGYAPLNFAFTSLWNIFQEINFSSTCNTETGAEICLAAYETLASVLKPLVCALSPLALDLIKNDDNLSLPKVEEKHVLDSMVVTFLQNISNLIAVGVLARSRRAVLMNWKWLCLESLLSIPYYALENGDHIQNNSYFFSDAAVRMIFCDLVQSLENAGEGSVLPMLRSVRFALGLLASGRLAVVSSCDGVDSQIMWDLVHSSWILHANCNKRRVAPIAALLSSVLHSSVFKNESLHVIGNEPGPLKWFIEKVLEEGTRSPRTIRLAALHLTGQWLLNPKIIKYYMKELKLLSLYGSVAFDEDFEAELAENHDAKKEVSCLAKSPDPELTEAFLNTELYARVSVAVLFFKLADMVDAVGSVNENENCCAALESGKLFLLELLDSAVNDNDLSKELYKKYSAIHRRKIRVWQMICVLSRFVDQDIVQQVAHSLHICLYRNNLPAVRQYLETFAIHIYLKFPSLVGEQLVLILQDYDMKPQALSSYVFIAANVILHASKAVQSSHLDELLPPVVPLLTSHHHSLRGFTQLLVYQVLCKLFPLSNDSDSQTMPLEKRCFVDLKSYLEKNSDCARLRASMEGYLNAFDPKNSATPSGIFTNRVEELEFECVPASLMEQVLRFLNDVRDDLRCSMAKDTVTIQNESLRIDEHANHMKISVDSSNELVSTQLPKDISFDFQKKITLSKNEVQGIGFCSFMGNKETYKPFTEMEKEDLLLDQLLRSRSLAMEKSRAGRQHFILVASLLDRIPNLAGLARTCEVFKAAGLAIADANILHDKQFQLISVTAEKWVPIIEVPVNSVKVFLEKKKQEGFSILGLEQTANSIPLDQYNFPKKMVLLLGREKEGIPVDLIHILDACIEIPQLGVVRSLNVHVSGAIALWEYTRQQRSK